MGSYISVPKITEDQQLHADISGNEDVFLHQDKSVELQKMDSSDMAPRQDTLNSESEPNRSQNK
jgi:hypothetical protein